MDLGNKIMELRKKNNLSQEELAEKIGVTRQTISKWELGETSPDIKQAKQLSKIFKISLDELTNNDINNLLIEKVSNTEKLAGLVIKILKFLALAFIIVVIVDIVAFFLYTTNKSSNREIIGEYSITCVKDNEEYIYGIQYNKNYQIITAGGDAYISDHTNIENYDNARKASYHIEDWFNNHNGSCIIEEKGK